MSAPNDPSRSGRAERPRRPGSPGHEASDTTNPTRRPRGRGPAPGKPVELRIREIDALRGELERRVTAETPRWNADPEEVQRSVARLVLTLVEFLRKLFEKQTLRRLEDDTLTPEQTEALGLALMRLEETITDLARRFDLAPEDLNLDLGPLGRLD
ncbi:MAG: gas vesicle protein K [Burkholderiales bacterium]